MVKPARERASRWESSESNRVLARIACRRKGRFSWQTPALTGRMRWTHCYLRDNPEASKAVM